MEAIFEVTLQDGAILRFLDLRIIKSPAGISIDQTDHIVETIVTPFQEPIYIYLGLYHQPVPHWFLI
jgi:hypothetical protein